MFEKGRLSFLGKDTQVTPGVTTKFALGATALELIGAGAEYAAAGKIDKTLLALAALTAVTAGVSKLQDVVSSGMAQTREDMDQTLDRIQEITGPSE